LKTKEFNSDLLNVIDEKFPPFKLSRVHHSSFVGFASSRYEYDAMLIAGVADRKPFLSEDICIKTSNFVWQRTLGWFYKHRAETKIL
jgi:hypothetical protein